MFSYLCSCNYGGGKENLNSVTGVLLWFAEDADGGSDAGMHSCETLMEAVEADASLACVVTERAAGSLALSLYRAHSAEVNAENVQSWIIFPPLTQIHTVT